MTDPGSPDWMARIVTSVILIVGWVGLRALYSKPAPKPTEGDVARLQAEVATLRGQLTDSDERDAKRVKRYADLYEGVERLEARGSVVHMFVRQEEERQNPGLRLVHNDALEALEVYLNEINEVLRDAEPGPGSDNGSTPV